MNATMDKRDDGRVGARAAASLVLLGIVTLGNGVASGHVRPTGCTGTGLAFGITVFLADGVTQLPAGGTVTPCETIVYKANVGARAPSFNDCDFEGGSIIIRTPDGVDHNVTPVGGVPLIGNDAGSTNNVDSQSVSYTVRPQDIVGGQIFAPAFFGCAAGPNQPPGCQPPTLHNSVNNTIGQPTGSTSASNTVEDCVTNECIVCDPAQQFSFGGGTGQG